MVSTPSQTFAHARFRSPPPLRRGLDVGLSSLYGVFRRRQQFVTKILAQADEIDRRAGEWHDLTTPQLRHQIFELRDEFRRRRHIDDDHELINTALGVLRETASRKLGLRAYKVQLAGALALHRGYLAEMATGEGKTLTAALAAVLTGWTNRPCHIITVNDYLVQRDSKWLAPFYNDCGIEVGAVTGGMDPRERQDGYAAEITYATAKEVLADFLRDRLQAGLIQHPSRRLIRHLLKGGSATPGNPFTLRGLDTAIVDEADSVLIDEAATPLIISRQRTNQALVDASIQATEIISDFENGPHYRTVMRYKEIEFTRRGTELIDAVATKFSGLWRSPGRCEELIEKALLAREFYSRGKQYLIDDGKVVIVDEFTGRPMPMRSWQKGIHQAVEAKEHLEISDPAETIARRSFQRFFRYYYRLSGMSGTVREGATELWQIYNLPFLSIPTNRPCIREEMPDRIFATSDSKWQALVADVRRINASGRPILVGTRSVADSEKLASMLIGQGLRCKVLNAGRLREEATIISEAGRQHSITIATNMAGRGTDIVLGTGVAELGGLHVVALERHESQRIDRQLFGRSARQGDSGSCQAFVSVEDELIVKHLSEIERKTLRVMSNPGWEGKGRETLFAAAIARAQRKSERAATKQRRSVLRMDIWLDESLSFAGSEE
ncbi:MAG: preprotein translocase subunit SecA [Verrucomicrobiales bacterium]